MQAVEQPLETEEVYPCKGCGEILEEGKAFELAGNRWHIDCFRCNTCSTLLDSDANLLLLGDGSLICNNCTYSCSACGNKIEDLAILTGDQAFCANCFKCRNCKKKIDNLRYARTSQGIFCMQCHESLMARRRKKNKNIPRAISANSNGSGPSVVLDKSLPALPPHALPTGAVSGLMDVGEPIDPQRVLPSSTYGDEASMLSPQSDTNNPLPDNNFYLPVTLDVQEPGSLLSRRQGNGDSAREYFVSTKGIGTEDEFQDLVAGSSRSPSKDRRSALPSPHIFSQQRGGQASTDLADVLRKQRDTESAPSSAISPTASMGLDRARLSPPHDLSDADRDGSGLQNSKTRPGMPREDSKHSAASRSSSHNDSTTVAGTREGVDSSTMSSPIYFDALDPSTDGTRRAGSLRRARSPINGSSLANQYDRPARDDSLLKQSAARQVVQRKEVPRSPDAETALDTLSNQQERRPSSSSNAGKQEPKGLPNKSLNRSFAPGITSPLGELPLRSPRRPPSTKPPEDDGDTTTPRNGTVAPPPSHQKHRGPTESMSSIQSEHFSAHDSVEDEFGRRHQLGVSEHGGLFRRVSNAVKHGRSHSDKIHPGSPNAWKRNGSTEFTSPYLGIQEPREEATQLRSKLKIAEQRISDLEAEKVEMQDKLHGTNDLRSMNTELREKRTTMAFLDTQREMVIRELEVMTDHLAAAKESKGPLKMQDMQPAVVRDFEQALQKLKDGLGSQIDELMRRKNDLNNQITGLVQMKDRTYQEYEQINARNQQLLEMNAQLQNQQDPYKLSSTHLPSYSSSSNGLGILPTYDTKNNYLAPVDSSASQISIETEVDSTTGLAGAKVVDVRKGQPKKFNWKKGGQVVAKGVSKGIKGAFASAQSSVLREEQFAESVPYGAIAPGDAPLTGNAPLTNRANSEQRAQWLLGQGKGPPQIKTANGTWTGNGQGNSPTYVAPESGIFGADLVARCEYEKRIVPAIVSRCIEEVEARGIDAEGIYRKSGSASQVKAIQVGFEQDPLQYDISDPDLDVHAVTSALKQYFRKLPNPLITYEVYEALLEAVTGEAREGGMGLGMSFAASLAANGGPSKDDEERARRVRDVLDTLPPSHRETLEFLIEHLVRVMEHESDNLMTPLNLAVVFAPTIMRPHSIEREMTDMQAQRSVVQLLLEQARIIFGGEE